jgi:hypothetical protein
MARPAGDLWWPIAARLVSGIVLLALVKLSIPSKMAFVMLWVVHFVLAARSKGNEVSGWFIIGLTSVAKPQSPRGVLSPHDLSSPILSSCSSCLGSKDLGETIVLRRPFHSGPVTGTRICRGLQPRSRIIDKQKVSTRHPPRILTISRLFKVAEVATLVLGAVAAVIAPRHPFLVLPAANLVFMALCTVMFSWNT